MDQQNESLCQHQSAKPRNCSVKLLGPDHQHDIEATDQTENAGNHPEPVIEHGIVGNWLSAQSLQEPDGFWPAQKNSCNCHSPGASSETEE